MEYNLVGLKKVKLQKVDHHVDELMDSIFTAYSRHAKHPRDIALLVNNLGSTTNMEMAIVVRRAAHVARNRLKLLEQVGE